MFPPGVARRIGYKNRVHFFDSVVQVLDFLKTNEKWKNEIALRRLLAEEERCVSLQEKLKTKAWPKFASNDEMVAWVREKRKETIMFHEHSRFLLEYINVLGFPKNPRPKPTIYYSGRVASTT